MSLFRALCCPKPDELVKMYLQGLPIENLVNDVYRSRMFVKKSGARAYVNRVIYDYKIKKDV